MFDENLRQSVYVNSSCVRRDPRAPFRCSSLSRRSTIDCSESRGGTIFSFKSYRFSSYRTDTHIDSIIQIQLCVFRFVMSRQLCLRQGMMISMHRALSMEVISMGFKNPLHGDLNSMMKTIPRKPKFHGNLSWDSLLSMGSRHYPWENWGRPWKMSSSPWNAAHGIPWGPWDFRTGKSPKHELND